MAYFDDSTDHIVGTASDDVVDITSSNPSWTTYITHTYDGNDVFYIGPYVPNYVDIHGGDGVDTFYAVGSVTVTIDLDTAVWGFSTLISSYVTGIENVFGTSVNDLITGNSGNNLLNGGAGGDSLAARGGIDTLDYRDSDAGVSVDLATNVVSGGHADGDIISGFERVWGSAFDDTLTGDAGRNQLAGYAGDDLLSGGGAVDVLRGLDGADTLNGGAGGDRLTGGADDDVFVYSSISESRVWTQRDTITDFQMGDKIDLSAIDADGSTIGDEAFHFAEMFDGTAGALRCGMTGSGMTVLADLDGDRHIDFAINLEGISSLSASDFIL